MKKFLLLCLIGASLNTTAQTKVKLDANGNYISLKESKPADKPTGKKYTDDKGITYDVFLNSKDKAYIIRKSKKTGKEYKQYLQIL
jgi:hypothetical protein